MNVKPVNSRGTAAARATRLLRLLAVCLIPALSGLAALPAASQTTETYVSNTGQTANNQGVSVDWFTQFTTGSNTGGYKLTAVDMVLPDGATMTATFEVKVFTTTSNDPDSSLGTLTAPATPISGTNTFTASGAGIDLDASTTYGVLFDVTSSGTGSVGATNNDAEDSGAATGWSIANTSRQRVHSGGNWSTDSGSLRFAIKGQAKTATSPTITIAADTSPVTEGTAATFTVTADPAPSADLTVNLTVADASGSDFVVAGDEGSKTVTIAASQTTATHSVPTVADSTDETDGDVTVTMATGTGYTVGSTSSASVRVNDDDGAPSVSSVAIVSKPRTDANSDGTPETYGAGQNITVAVTWSKAMTWDLSAATNAGIGVRLNIGGTQRRAELVTGGATSGAATTLWFSYTVISGDTDTDGIAVTTASGNRLVLVRNGATLKGAEGDNAEMTHAGLTAQSGLLVDAGVSAVPEPAPFRIRVQTEADLEADRFEMLAWENPFARDGPASPFWRQDGMPEGLLEPGARPLVALVGGVAPRERVPADDPGACRLRDAVGDRVRHA